jgi:urease accessory protein
MRKLFQSGPIIAIAGFAASATPALAHPGHDQGGLIAGLVHPFTGVDHLAAMAAVGLWAATRPARQAWQAPALFMAALTVGGGLGVALGAMPGVEMMVAASVLVLGGLLMLATRVGSGLALSLIGGAGCCTAWRMAPRRPARCPPISRAFWPVRRCSTGRAGWRGGRSLRGAGADGGRFRAGSHGPCPARGLIGGGFHGQHTS